MAENELPDYMADMAEEYGFNKPKIKKLPRHEAVEVAVEKKPFVDMDRPVRHPDFGRDMALSEVANHARVVRNEKHEYRDLTRRGKRMLKDRSEMQENWNRHTKATAVNNSEMNTVANSARQHFSGDTSPEADLVREAADNMRAEEHAAVQRLLESNVDQYNNRGQLVRKGVISPEYARVLLEMPLSRKKSVMVVDAIENSVANLRIAELAKAKAEKKDLLVQKKVLLERDLSASDGSVFDALDARDKRLSETIANSVDAVGIVRERYAENTETFDAITAEIDNIEDTRYRANESYRTGNDEKVKAGADMAMVRMQRYEERSRENGDMTLSTQMNVEELSYFALGVAMVREAALDSDTKKSVVGQILAERALQQVNRRIRALATAQDRDPAVTDYIVEQMTGRLRQMFTVKSKKVS
jgi:hypothetical protein